MISTYLSLAAAVSYGLGLFFQRRNLTSGQQNRSRVFITGGIALLLHLWVILQITLNPDGIDFSFFKVASLVSWVIVITTLASSFKRPVDTLFLYLFPLAIICLLCSTFIPSVYDPLEDYSIGVGIHILLGILAVAIITIAACQTLLNSFLNRLLKEKRSLELVSHLPPLETMEALLFDMIWLGLLLLTGVLFTGVVFMEDFYGQHLSHKAVLSTISWLVFSILLWGRHQLGWRGKTANRWIMTGYAFLILAYFGSKFVLEIILDRI